MKHANIAFFIPHNGCQNQCSFCNQRSIVGQQAQPAPQQITETLLEAAEQMGDRAREAEVAFFGGSFTAIDLQYQEQLLLAAFPFIRKGLFRGIRISTRPDAISPEILQRLKAFGVTAIELGAQSMNDRVLNLNQRGHTARDVENAARLIKEYGFSLGLQMMTGLYGSSLADDWSTARSFVLLRPDTVRIYPTVVMKHTPLAALYESGVYQPLDVTASVELCAQLLQLFERNHIPVIRLGLHDSPQLRRDMLAGGFHPAFRELCESSIFLQRLTQRLNREKVPAGRILVSVFPKELSIAIGQKKSNLLALARNGYSAKVEADPSLAPGQFRVKSMME